MLSIRQTSSSRSVSRTSGINVGELFRGSPTLNRKGIDPKTDINIDDCWSTKTRDGNGKLVPDPSKWPSGIKSVTDQIHNLGLKFGLYGCAGQQTCAGFPGSDGGKHAASDVSQLVEWGVDFWYVALCYTFLSLFYSCICIPIQFFAKGCTHHGRKYDNCYTPCLDNPPPQTCQRPSANTQTWYAPMRDAIVSAQDKRKIHFNLCNWGRDSVWTWGANFGHSWR